MKKTIQIIFIFIISSCQIHSGNNKSNVIIRYTDSCCSEKITKFHYPESLNHLDTMYPDSYNYLDTIKYICNDTILAKKIRNETPYFSDKNYAIYYHDSYIKLLYDKRNDIFLCFKIYSGLSNFKKELVHTIYFLDSNEFPLFSITKDTDIEGSIVLKYFYDKLNGRLYSKLLKLNFYKKIEELEYDDIVKLGKMLKQKKYIEKIEGFEYDEYYLEVPLWE